MSVMTPSEMMSRMKYCEPSVTADAYLAPRERETEESEVNWVGKTEERIQRDRTSASFIFCPFFRSVLPNSVRLKFGQSSHESPRNVAPSTVQTAFATAAIFVLA